MATASLDDIAEASGTAKLDDIAEPVQSKTVTLSDIDESPAQPVKKLKPNDSMGGPTPNHPAAPPPQTAGDAFEEMATAPILPLSKLAPDQPTSVAGGVAKGAAQFAEGLTTPANVMLAAAPFGEVGAALGKIGAYLPRAVAGVFSLDMLHSAYQQYPEVKAAIDKKDWPGAAEAITKAGLTAAMGVLAGTHAVRGSAPETTPEKAVESARAGVAALSDIQEPETPRVSSAADIEAPGTAKLDDIQQAVKEPNRKVSGSVNIPLNDQGRQQMADLAQKTAGQFTSIEHAPNDRAAESAQIVAQGSPQAQVAPAPGLTPWALGEHEGQPVETEKEAIAQRIRETPDEAPPGGHDQSTTPGEPFNDAKDRTIDHLKDQVAQFEPGGKTLNIASGRTLRMVDAWLKNGAPDDGSVDVDHMTKEGDWHKNGDLFRIQNNGLEPVLNAEQPGIYYARHGATDWNGEAKPEEATVAKDATVPARLPQITPAAGRETSIAVPGETTKYPARYAVRELSDVQASHNPQTFLANPAYEHTNDRDYSRGGNASRVIKNSAADTFDPNFVTTEAPTAEHGMPIIDRNGNVLGGNSRTMAIARVYNRGGADEYMRQVDEKAQQLGINPEEFRKFKRPVLVRELTGDVDPQRAITDFNKSAAAELTPEERAVSDGRHLSPETVTKIAANIEDVGEESTLAQSLKGDNGADILNSLVKDGVLTEQEKGGYLDEKGNLTGDAKNRIAKALVGRLYDSPADYRATTPEMRSKLERIAPQMLRVEGREDWSLGEPLREAVALAEDARVHKLTVDQQVKQSGMWNDQKYSPDAVALAKTLGENPVRAGAAFRRYANDEALSRPGGQSAMFTPPTREEAFGDAFGQTTKYPARYDDREAITLLYRSDANSPRGGVGYWGTPSRDYAEGVGGDGERRGGGKIEQLSLPKSAKVLDLGKKTGYTPDQAIKAIRRGFPKASAEEVDALIDRSLWADDDKQHYDLPDLIHSTEEQPGPLLAELMRRHGYDAIRFQEPLQGSDMAHEGQVQKGRVATYFVRTQSPSSIIMGSGLGGLQPIYEKFEEQDLKPALQNISSGLVEAKDQITKMLAPQLRGEAAELMGLSLRARMGQFARRFDQGEMRLREASRFFDQRSPEENYRFIDDIERGRSTGDEHLDTIAGMFRKMLDQRRNEVRNLGEGALQQFYTHYFPHIFEREQQAEGFVKSFFGRRTMEGPKSFLKHREFPTFKEALDAGMKPVSDNPVRLVLMKAREMDRYLLAHNVLRDMAERGVAKRLMLSAEGAKDGQAELFEGKPLKPDWLVPKKGQLPPDFKQIVDPVGGGRWFAQEGAADVLNNYLTPGLRAKSGAYRILVGVNNTMNQANLGLSAFHLTGEIIRSGVSRAALGVEDIMNGKPVRGSLRIASFPAGPFLDFVEGSKALKDWYKPGSEGAPVAAITDALMKGGGRVGQPAEYSNQMVARMQQAFHSGNHVGGLLRAPFALLEQTAKPMMEYLIPRLKLGTFAGMARNEMERLGPGATVDETRKAMSSVWDSVDNRMGQMVYDNLFWHRTFKDLAHLMVRSVGWNLGTIREIGGGVAALRRPQDIRNAENIHKVAYTLALPLVSGMIGAMYQYAHTGKGPSQLKDYFFPKRADGSRITLPTDVKDVYHYATAPVRTVENKTGPLINTLVEMLHNRDYYDRPIRGEGDPLIKQLKEEADFIGRQFLPFTVQPMAGSKKGMPAQTTEQKAEGFAGFTRAPNDLQDNTKKRKPQKSQY